MDHDDKMKRAEQSVQAQLDAMEERDELEAEERDQQVSEDFQADEEYRRVHGNHPLQTGELPSERRKRVAIHEKYKRYEEARDARDEQAFETLRATGGK